MAVARSLRRLLRIRELEEEQERLELELALGCLHRLERAQAAALEQNRRGRRLVGASIGSGELRDRWAGLEESRTAERWAEALAPQIAEAGEAAAEQRAAYLARRVERRQAEALIEEAESSEALEAGRRSQQALDDWFRNRLHRRQARGKPAGTADLEGEVEETASKRPERAEKT